MLKLNLFFYLLILIALYHCKLHVVTRREPKGLLTRTTMTTLDECIKLGVDYHYDPKKENYETWEVRVEGLVGTIPHGGPLISLLDHAYDRNEVAAIIPQWQNEAWLLSKEEVDQMAAEGEWVGADIIAPRPKVTAFSDLKPESVQLDIVCCLRN